MWSVRNVSRISLSREVSLQKRLAFCGLPIIEDISLFHASKDCIRLLDVVLTLVRMIIYQSLSVPVNWFQELRIF